MAINVVVENKEESPAKFPKLMISKNDESIVLFTRDRVGTVVFNIFGGYFIGEHKTDWNITTFKDFEGSVSLSNK